IVRSPVGPVPVRAPLDMTARCGLATTGLIVNRAADDCTCTECSEGIPPAVIVAAISATVLSRTSVASILAATIVAVSVKAATVPIIAPILYLFDSRRLRRLHRRHHDCPCGDN